MRRAILQAASMALLLSQMGNTPPVRVEYTEPKPVKPSGPTKKRAKVKLARKQRKGGRGNE